MTTQKRPGLEGPPDGKPFLVPARCAICGCDDDAECEDGCEWVWVDRDCGAGLCSACVVAGVQIPERVKCDAMMIARHRNLMLLGLKRFDMLIRGVG